MTQRARFDNRILWLIPAPLFVLVGSELLLFGLAAETSGTCTVIGGEACSPPPANTPVSIRRHASAILMISAFAAMLFTCAFSVVAFSVFAFRLLLPRSFRTAFAVVGLVVVSVIILSAAIKWLLPNWSDIRVLTSCRKCTGGNIANCVPASLSILLFVSSLALILASTCVVIGTGMALCSPLQSKVLTLNESSRAEDRSSLDVGYGIAQFWLMTGSCILVCGLVFHFAWGRWLADFMNRAHMINVVSAFTPFNGVRFSCFIAAYFIPVVFLLWSRAGPDRRLPDILLEVGSAKAVMAVLAPVFASFAAPLLTLKL